jgi:cell division protein FtsW (lipid II flippase)
MTPQFWFWIFFVLALLGNLYLSYDPPHTYRRWVGVILYFVLVLILGIAVFGGPVKGQ